jgi:hypothetical protein
MDGTGEQTTFPDNLRCLIVAAPCFAILFCFRFISGLLDCVWKWQAGCYIPNPN